MTAAPATASSPRGRLSAASREVRLGLVVYGGVSLAIYINGVAHELFRAVRGRGIYKLLKRLVDADIVVDIVSGTSAGGINGLLLAYALTNEREFAACADLWREHGSLARLLRPPDDIANATSLLDSRNYYIPKIEDALTAMPPISSRERETERVSALAELDVFVTGTNFDGRLTTAVDATGRRIDVKTHRTVFQLKHRAGRKTPFAVSAGATSPADRDRVAALARLCAITSCFPAAFEPVHVAPSADRGEGAVYEQLREWGRLDGEAWFLDGGVLDNKPFSYTIQEIYNRTASRPVERKLLYVEPDPERFDPARARRAGAPTIVQAAVDALLGIPGYESIAEDLESIARRNDRLRRQAQVRVAAEEAFAATAAGAAGALSGAVMAIYRNARLAQMREKAVAHLIDDPWLVRGAAERVANPEADRERWKVVAALVHAFNNWEGSGDDTLDRFDVYFRVRRVFYVIYKVADAVSRMCDAEADEPSVSRGRGLWEALNQQLAAYEIVQWAMEQTVKRHPMPRTIADADANAVWKGLETKLAALLVVDDAGGELLERAGSAAMAGRPDQWKELHEVLSRRIETVSDRGFLANAPALAEGPNLLQRLDRMTELRLAGARTAEAETLRGEWNSFAVYDAHFFPIDYFADLGEKDPIDVVRVSPLDAERGFCSRRFEDKVTGETVMHFGAFLKRSWRSNDIMWGRLDGVCRILDTLLTREALEKAVGKREVRELLRKDIGGDLDPAVLFPAAGERIQASMRAWLLGLASEDRAARAAALADEPALDLLLWCAQLEILETDLPKVLVDTAREQLEWNNLAVTDAAGQTEFRRLERHVDLAWAVNAAERVTREFVDDLRKDAKPFDTVREAPLAEYFLNKYTVGAETVRDHIPPSVLLETVTAALLVARNCLVNAFPQQARAVTSRLSYKALVDWPLRTVHALAVLARRERPFYLASIAVLITYAIAALGAVVLWPKAVLYGTDGLKSTNALALIVVPLMILVPGLSFVWARAQRYRGGSSGARVGLALLSVVGVLLGLALVWTFVVAWAAMTVQLADCIVALGVPRSAYNEWLAGSLLAGLVLAVLVVVPAIRGIVQSWVARAATRRPHTMPRA